jgi:hypothetical protein
MSIYKPTSYANPPKYNPDEVKFRKDKDNDT